MTKTVAFKLCLAGGLTGLTLLSACRSEPGVDWGTGGTGGRDIFPGTGGFNACPNTNAGPGPMPFASDGGSASTRMFVGGAQPQYGATITREQAPPAISGGTLLILKDGHTAIASDPDRDRISVVDLTSKTVKASITLTSGDEPGRAVEDAAGRVHVALRRGGAVVTLQPTTWTMSERQAVCAAPRGLAFDAKADRIHVACAGGELVSLAAAGGPAVRTLQLERDLRDVVVDGDNLMVSRFRSAQMITLDGNGKIVQRLTPPTFRSFEAHNNERFTPSVAWRMMAMPGGGVAMVHQRGMEGEVQSQFGGYGSGNPCDAIVQTAVVVVNAGTMPTMVPAIPAMVLPVDMAISPDGKRVALIAAGNATNTAQPGGQPALPRVFAANISDVIDPAVGCRMDGTHGPCVDLGFGGGFNGAGGAVGAGGALGSGGSSGVGGDSGGMGAGAPAPGPRDVPPTTTCPAPPAAHPGEVLQPTGEPIALAYDGAATVVVQTRQPAALQLASGAIISLSNDSREDTGHTIFHSNAGGFMACASCHSEGSEDGRVWNFACEGERRTQTLADGISGTAPFHWNGDMTDFSVLMQSVFVERMSGPKLAGEQLTAALRWIDNQPRVPQRAPADPASVARGHALFNDPKVACGTCHAGEKLTDNKSVDVGTGGPFQVPSLLGIATRAPFMHNGCASTLADRFGPCGGGDKHGVTSQLAKEQITDLVNYLETL
jgi:hypothetical protein